MTTGEKVTSPAEKKNEGGFVRETASDSDLRMSPCFSGTAWTRVIVLFLPHTFSGQCWLDVTVLSGGEKEEVHSGKHVVTDFSKGDFLWMCESSQPSSNMIVHMGEKCLFWTWNEAQILLHPSFHPSPPSPPPLPPFQTLPWPLPGADIKHWAASASSLRNRSSPWLLSAHRDTHCLQACARTHTPTSRSSKAHASLQMFIKHYSDGKGSKMVWW